MRGVRGVCVACGRRLGAGQAWVHKNARAALPGSPSRHLPGRTRAHATVHVLHHTPVVVVVRKEVSLSVRGAVHSGRQLTAGIQASRQPRWCWDTSWARSTPSHGLDVTHTPLWYTLYAPPRPTPMWRPDGDRLSPALHSVLGGVQVCVLSVTGAVPVQSVPSIHFHVSMRGKCARVVGTAATACTPTGSGNAALGRLGPSHKHGRRLTPSALRFHYHIMTCGGACGAGAGAEGRETTPGRSCPCEMRQSPNPTLPPSRRVPYAVTVRPTRRIPFPVVYGMLGTDRRAGAATFHQSTWCMAERRDSAQSTSVHTQPASGGVPAHATLAVFRYIVCAVLWHRATRGTIPFHKAIAYTTGHWAATGQHRSRRNPRSAQCHACCCA